MLINQFATFLSYKSVLYLFSVIDESSVTVFGQYCLPTIIHLYKPPLFETKYKLSAVFKSQKESKFQSLEIEGLKTKKQGTSKNTGTFTFYSVAAHLLKCDH